MIGAAKPKFQFAQIVKNASMIPARGPQTRFFDILCRFRNAIDATWGRRGYLGAWQILAFRVINSTWACGVTSEHGQSWHSSSSMLPGAVLGLPLSTANPGAQGSPCYLGCAGQIWATT